MCECNGTYLASIPATWGSTNRRTAGPGQTKPKARSYLKNNQLYKKGWQNGAGTCLARVLTLSSNPVLPSSANTKQAKSPVPVATEEMLLEDTECAAQTPVQPGTRVGLKLVASLPL
jgi:hypothetical protein